MSRELLLAAFIMGVGLSVAGAGTYLYQWLTREEAALRVDGNTLGQSFLRFVVSVVCGPYIMLQYGWKQEDDGTLSMPSMLISSLVAFGWSFVTGLLIMSVYVLVLY
ncbi:MULTISPECIES: hypothetical protein [unclassified Devosia]|uniref:DUF6949 family protein n=1 Tax=unclassified Devosia TaxID=196773 RepID=UPI00145E6189|nr:MULTISPECIES: hypothetical protein [unclassified Devosia]MBJ6986117.1 hypothetical protein [Devosia sp. MC521]MBJ7578913.1 hypothetical protein [Devosia sp. MC532]MBK1793572.1 hypothetical protein [Devosia sp. WQ 349K1]QMW61485.1 hypothetical protein H4N61_10890 [Devosia sp. MC521]